MNQFRKPPGTTSFSTEPLTLEEMNPSGESLELVETGRPKTGIRRNREPTTWYMYILYIIGALVSFYFFVCAIGLLSKGFQLMTGHSSDSIFSSSAVTNPLAGVMIGILLTVLMQSSSASTSVIVAVVASGSLDVSTAVYMVMGANIGTSVTNTIVALIKMEDREQFRITFSVATVHDMFNFLTIAVLLPIEVLTGVLVWTSGEIVGWFDLADSDVQEIELFKFLTDPFTNLIVRVDEEALGIIADDSANSTDVRILKIYCPTNENPENKCQALWSQFGWSDIAAGGVLLVISLVMLLVSVMVLSKMLGKILGEKAIASIVEKIIKYNSSDACCAESIVGYLSILVGTLVTFLVQSSSVFTSTLVVMASVGVLDVHIAYPLTLGSNIGTTFTSLIAALQTTGKALEPSIQISLCHTLYNVIGILCWYPLPPLRAVPKIGAIGLGNTVSKYRWFAIVYILGLFFILPGIVFGISFLGGWAIIAFGTALLIPLILVLALKGLQGYARENGNNLPRALSPENTFERLPLYLRSLEPYDRWLGKLLPKKCQFHDEEITVEISIRSETDTM